MIDLATASLPTELRGPAQRAWAAIIEDADPELRSSLQSLLNRTDFQTQLQRVLAGSRFIGITLRQHPALLLELASSGDLERSYSEADMYSRLDDLLSQAVDLDSLSPPLRVFRRREMVRLLWRDFNRTADTVETTRDVSLLAEAVIDRSVSILQKGLEQELGTPSVSAAGTPQRLIVIAMGKLGARELNVSSDIDLIFAYPEAGETENGPRSVWTALCFAWTCVYAPMGIAERWC
jgi:glutamate-ammonia-ligase adenylyltransferase